LCFSYVNVMCKFVHIEARNPLVTFRGGAVDQEASQVLNTFPKGVVHDSKTS
jgi:hypothetical protein